MKIGVVVREHPWEKFPTELGKSLEGEPIEGVTLIDAYAGFAEGAWEEETENIAMMYPGQLHSASAARHRAARTLQQCMEGEFDVVFSMHTTEYDSANDTLQAANHGDTIITSERALILGGLLRLGAGRGQKPVIFADNHGISWSVRNVIGIELGRNSKLKNVELWRRELGWLASLDWERDAGIEFYKPELTPYRRVIAATYAHRSQLGLAEEYPAFTKLPPNPHYIDTFGTDSELQVVAWGLKYPPYSGQVIQRWPEALDRKVEWPGCCTYHSDLYIDELRHWTVSPSQKSPQIPAQAAQSTEAEASRSLHSSAVASNFPDAYAKR